MSFDSNKLRFLESPTNLRAAIKRNIGRSPRAEIARDISACLQQGRLFFEVASSSHLQIQPLQIYYGMVGFAKAVVLSSNVRSIATIAQSHGLSDISNNTSQIEDLRVRFNARGVFQQFNDAIASQSSIRYYKDSMLQTELKPFDSAIALDKTEASLKNLLARIPGLQELYRRTFEEDAECWGITINYNHGLVDLRIDDPILFKDKDDLRQMVAKWRAKFPWLNDWCFAEASHAWDNTVLIFKNKQKPMSGELSDDVLRANGDGFFARTENQMGIEFITILPPLAGGITRDHPTAISPLNGVALSEFSVQFIAAFLLSTLVRYRPQVWQHAISHSITQTSIADDRALSLIELYTKTVLYNFPSMVVETIDPTR
jgi:hypothetical protein